jgi:hypothetical protein
MISLSGIADGSGKIAKGKITFFCQNCEEEITTTVASYSAAKTNTVSVGCRNCKKIHAKKREAEKNANLDKGLKRTHRKARVWTNHSPLKSREALRFANCNIYMLNQTLTICMCSNSFVKSLAK